WCERPRVPGLRHAPPGRRVLLPALEQDRLSRPGRDRPDRAAGLLGWGGIAIATLVLRLQAPRRTFALDMSDEEREIMGGDAAHRPLTGFVRPGSSTQPSPRSA